MYCIQFLCAHIEAKSSPVASHVSESHDVILLCSIFKVSSVSVDIFCRYLDSNAIETLPDGVFAHLTKLTIL